MDGGRLHPFSCRCVDCRPDLIERRVEVALLLLAAVGGLALATAVPADVLCGQIYGWACRLVGAA